MFLILVYKDIFDEFIVEMFHIRVTNVSPSPSEEVFGHYNTGENVGQQHNAADSTGHLHSETGSQSLGASATAGADANDQTRTDGSSSNVGEPESHTFTCGSSAEMICGKLRFFRSPGPVLKGPNSKTLAVLAVPIRLSGRDFLNFCGYHVQNIEHLRFIKDSDPSWYSVVLRFTDKDSAWQFYNYQNGRQFTSLGNEVCLVVQVSSIVIEDIDSGAFTLDAERFLKHGNEGKSSSPQQAESAVKEEETRELPTCPVCLERLDASVSGLITTMCNHSFHRLCLSKWKDSSCPVCRYVMDDTESSKPSCEVCGADDVWMCIVCGHVGCGRYNGMHAVRHFHESGHAYAMELSTQRVWDYAGDGYVHRLIQNKTDGKIVELPEPGKTTYCVYCGKANPTQELSEDSAAAANGLTRSREGPATDVKEDDNVVSKMDALSAEYNALLTSQLEVQRDYYEKKLSELREKNESENDSQLKKTEERQQLEEEVQRLRKALKQSQSRVNQLERSLKAYSEELDFLKEINSSLEKNQAHWEKQIQSIKQDAATRQKQKDDEIADLKEQVRDLMFSLETQRKVEETDDVLREDIQQGSVHIAEGGSSPSNKRHPRRKR